MRYNDLLAWIGRVTGSKIRTFRDLPAAEAMRDRYRDSVLLDSADTLIGLNLGGIATSVTDAIWDEWQPQLPHLQALNLRGAGIQHLKLHLPDLQWLDVSESALKCLDFEEDAPKLDYLDLNESQIQQLDLPEACTALRILDISRCKKLNRLHLPAEMPVLERLDASDGALKTFTIPAGDKLAHVYLNGNQLTNVEFAGHMPTLRTLHLRNNQLNRLPGGNQFIRMAPKVEALYLSENPWAELPKEFIEGENKSSMLRIRGYLESLVADEIVPNDEVKWILLGNSTAGKSSLVRYLEDKTYTETDLASTHGLEYRHWRPAGQPFGVNIWDFGGQEFYHATHRLFLSDNAVCLVLFEPDTNFQGESPLPVKVYENGVLCTKTLAVEHFEHTYWLHSLKHFCGNLPPKVLIAQSKLDLGKSDTKPVDFEGRLIEILRLSVKGAVDGGEEYQISCKAVEIALIKALKETLATYEISARWRDIRTELRRIAPKTPFLAYKAYRILCERLRPGISEGGNASMLSALTDYLHKTGAIFYHPQSSSNVFLSPKWLIEDVIYRVLDYRVIHNEGRFDRAHVETVTPAGLTAGEVIALMKDFELIFEAKDGDGQKFVAPQYLPATRPETKELKRWESSGARQLLFALQFPDFLPRSVMVRLLCRYGNLSLDTYWRSGLLLEKDGTAILIEHDHLTLSVYAKAPQTDLASLFFKDLLELSQATDELLISPDGSHWVKYGILKRHNPLNPMVSCEQDNDVEIAAFRLFFPVGEPTQNDRSLFWETYERKVVVKVPPAAHPEWTTGPTKEAPWKLQFIESTPMDTPRLNTPEEWRTSIEESLKLGQTALFDLKAIRLATRADDLTRIAAQGPHIIHFSGHGTTEGLVLTHPMGEKHEHFGSDKLLNLLEDLQGITRIIVLNACYSADIAQRASALGMYVVGYHSPVADKAALAFAKGFYIALSEGNSPTRAFNLGCTQLLNAFPDGAIGEVGIWYNGKQLNG